MHSRLSFVRSLVTPVVSVAMALSLSTPAGAAAFSHESRPPGRATSAAPGASRSGVEVAHQLHHDTTQTVRVDLTFSGVVAEDGVAVSYTVKGPATLVSQDAQTLFPGGPATRQVTVRLQAGTEVPYLNVFTRQRGRAGVVSIALTDGAGRLKAAPYGQHETGATGERRVVLPGELRSPRP